MKTSGKPGEPIVFMGEQGATKNEWKTIIDASDELNDWVPSSMGPGVFEAKNVPYKVFWLGVGDRDILRVAENSYLKEPPSALHNNGYSRTKVNFWDGFEALWFGTGTATGHWPSHYRNGANPGTVHVRFRNGDDPNAKEMRISNGDPAVDLENQHDIVLRGFLIRGARLGIRLKGKKCTHNIIENNRIMNGGMKIQITEASNLIIRNNVIHRNGLGDIEPGPFNRASGTTVDVPEPGTPLHTAAVREKFYRALKTITFFEYGYGISLNPAQGSAHIEISGNRIYDIVGDAIVLHGVRDVAIHHNEIHNASSVAIMPYADYANVRIHDNLLHTNNINLRFLGMDELPDRPKQAFIYRNRLWNPEGFGWHTYWHWTSGPTGNHETYFYHNSFAGGLVALNFSPGESANRQLGNTHFLNNVFSSARFMHYPPRNLGRFEHNWAGGDHLIYDFPGWFSESNVNADDREIWDNGADMPAFDLQADDARATGCDVTAVACAGRALPGFDVGYFAGKAPDMGAFPEPRPPPPTAFRVF
ncbi:MAG: right-handed parallel beta-helix repeat-containing protein [Gammaproteobacteria bacterium]